MRGFFDHRSPALSKHPDHGEAISLRLLQVSKEESNYGNG